MKEVSACFITKDPTYPKEILDYISQFPFGEILILTHSDSPFRKHELFAKAKYEWIFYQDDDAICPIQELYDRKEDGKITLAMKEGHYKAYSDTKMTMGIGWGCFFQKSLLGSLKRYTERYGEDEVYKRETERIFTALNYPQNRLVLPIRDLPSAYAEDRLWRQPNHNEFAQIANERCKNIPIN